MAIKLLIITGLLFSLLSCSDNASDKESTAPFDKEDMALILTVECYDVERVEVCQKALRAAKEVLDPDHIGIANVLNTLASAYMHENNFAESEPLYIESLKIAKKTLDSNSETVLEFTNDLGTLYRSMGKYDKAIELFKQSLELAQERLPTDDHALIGFLTDLSSGYVEVENYSEAKKLSKRALKIAKKTDPSYHHIIQPLKNLALAYSNQRKFAEAELLLKSSLEIMERDVEPKRLMVAQVQLDLAKTSYSLGKITETETLLKSSLNIFQKELSEPDRLIEALTGQDRSDMAITGPDRSFKATALLDLKDLYNKIGNVEGAARAEDLIEETRVWLTSEAKTRFEEGNYIKANGDCGDVLKFTEEEADSNYTSIGGILLRIGVEYREQGKLAAAEPYLKCSLEVLEKSPNLPPSHLTSALNKLALTYYLQKRYEDAKPLLKRSLKMAEKDLEPDDPLLATTLYNMALLYRTQLEIDKATPLLKRSIEIREKILSADHPDLGDSLALMGLLYGLQDNYNKATFYLERGLKIWKITRSANDPIVLAAHRNLEMYYSKAGKSEEAGRVEAYLNKHGF